jgi:hypothetical protein
LNSTLNMTYAIEFDAFTVGKKDCWITIKNAFLFVVVVLESKCDENENRSFEWNWCLDEINGDEIKMFLMYNLTGKQNRALSSMSVSVDNSSLGNITRLVSRRNRQFSWMYMFLIFEINNSIIQSQMNISTFVVVQANVNIESSMLNVTVLLRFMIKCTIHCQEIQVNKLKNTTSMNLEPIVIIYNGYVHFHNVSLTGNIGFYSILFLIHEIFRCFYYDINDNNRKCIE